MYRARRMHTRICIHLLPNGDSVVFMCTEVYILTLYVLYNEIYYIRDVLFKRLRLKTRSSTTLRHVFCYCCSTYYTNITAHAVEVEVIIITHTRSGTKLDCRPVAPPHPPPTATTTQTRIIIISRHYNIICI